MICRRKKLVPVFPLGLAVPVPESRADDAADMAAIQALWVRYEVAVLECDMKTCAALWDPEGLRRQIDPRLQHHDRLARAQIDWVEQPTSTVSLLPTEIVSLGDHAYAMGRYAVEFAKPRGNTRRVHGRFMAVLRRQSHRSWRIYRSMLAADDD